MNRTQWLPLLLIVAPSVAAAGVALPLRASVETLEAFGVGDLQAGGPGVAVYMPLQDEEATAPHRPILLLQGEEIRPVEVSWDYVGVEGATAVNRETTSRTEAFPPLAHAELAVAEVRARSILLVEPAGAGFTTHLDTASAHFEPVDDVDVRFFPETFGPAGSPPPDLQVVVTHDGPVVRATTQVFRTPNEVTGDFTLHLWEVDVRSAANPDDVHRSGILRSNGIGASAQFPEGLVYEARYQRLVLEVTHGRLSFAIPDHPTEFYLERAGSRVQSRGFWDLGTASGALDWNGARTDLTGQPVHLEGAFETTFVDGGAPDSMLTEWRGSADQVRAGDALLTAGAVNAVAGREAFAWMGPVVIGAVLATGLGGASAFTWNRVRAARVPGAAFARPIAAGDFDRALEVSQDALDEGKGGMDALIAKGVALLKLGRAQEVVDALEPAFDVEDPAAAVQAYLLSMAYLQLGRREEGTEWILRATDLYPEFADEIQFNDAFASIRTDRRVRERLGSGGDQETTGYA